MKTIGLVITLFISATCGFALPQPNGEQRIQGGQETTIDKYPAIVAIESLTISWNQACAGNILTSRYILTAAHCFRSVDPADRRVRAGSTNRNSGGVTVVFERYLNHPNWNYWTNENDISLGYLTSALTYTNDILPATILAQGTVVPDNAVVTHAGWGTLYRWGPNPTVLHEVDIEKVNSEVCFDRYRAHPDYNYYQFVITDGMICAGLLDVGGKDACQGDSGGPLYYLGNQFLIGIISWGPTECGSAVYPGVNTNVAHYTNWILENAV